MTRLLRNISSKVNKVRVSKSVNICAIFEVRCWDSFDFLCFFIFSHRHFIRELSFVFIMNLKLKQLFLVESNLCAILASDGNILQNGTTSSLMRIH